MVKTLVLIPGWTRGEKWVFVFESEKYGPLDIHWCDRSIEWDNVEIRLRLSYHLPMID